MSVDFSWPKRAFCRSPLVPYNTSSSPVSPKSQRWVGVRHFAPGAGPEKTLSVGSAKTRSKQRLGSRLKAFFVGFFWDPPQHVLKRCVMG